MNYRPPDFDQPSLLQPLGEAATTGKDVRTGKFLNHREVRCQIRNSCQSGRSRNFLDLLGFCINPLQGLALNEETLTHLLEVKPIGSLVTPVLNHFAISTRRVKLQEAKILDLF